MSEFTEYLHEIFELFGPIAVRGMFGGHGVYHDGVMFALVAGGTLYLKADAENASAFEQRKLGRFEYRKDGKVAQLSYYMAPAEMMDDREAAARWARRSFDAALRAQDRQRAREVVKQDPAQNAVVRGIPRRFAARARRKPECPG